MAHSRYGLKALALSGLAFGLLLFCSSAQAEVGANWMVNGANIGAALLPPVQVQEIENNDGSLLTKILGVSVKFLCTALELINARLGIEGKVDPFKGRFTGCETFLNGSLSAACLPIGHEGTEDVIETKELKGLIVLHEGAGLVRIEPVVGQVLALLLFGEECAIGEDVPVLGKVTGKDVALGAEAVSHLFVEGPLTEMWVISNTPEHRATLDGSLIVRLSGAAHLGLKWSGLPA